MFSMLNFVKTYPVPKIISNYSPPNPLMGEKREGRCIGDTPMTPAGLPLHPFSVNLAEQVQLSIANT
jgi:hypothetical protein